MNRMFHNNVGNDFPRNSPPFQNNMPIQVPPRQVGVFPNSGPRPNTPYNMAPFPPPGNQGRFQKRMGPPKRGPMSHNQQQNFAQMPFDQQANMNNQQKGGLLSKLLKKSGRRNNTPPPPPPPNGLSSPFALPTNQARNAAVIASQTATTRAASTTATSTAASTATSSGGVFKTLLNPGNLTNMLSNTQRVLQAAESFTPIVQQYGPLVKNIPAMWKMYRGLKDTDTTESKKVDDKPEVKHVPVQQTIETKIIDRKSVPIQETVHLKPHVKPRKNSPTPTPATPRFREGESKPKLFM
ncbi:VrrA/YqfQ family protein [Bacillus sp. JJ722]|uniref:VrrA/YqfQ family protein n=1 Tax=Bacillus sp. JJ722 TaxID=3122973 RepID=UPI002FFFEBF3